MAATLRVSGIEFSSHVTGFQVGPLLFHWQLQVDSESASDSVPKLAPDSGLSEAPARSRAEPRLGQGPCRRRPPSDPSHYTAGASHGDHGPHGAASCLGGGTLTGPGTAILPVSEPMLRPRTAGPPGPGLVAPGWRRLGLD